MGFYRGNRRRRRLLPKSQIRAHNCCNQRGKAEEAKGCFAFREDSLESRDSILLLGAKSEKGEEAVSNTNTNTNTCIESQSQGPQVSKANYNLWWNSSSRNKKDIKNSSSGTESKEKSSKKSIKSHHVVKLNLFQRIWRMICGEPKLDLDLGLKKAEQARIEMGMGIMGMGMGGLLGGENGTGNGTLTSTCSSSSSTESFEDPADSVSEKETDAVTGAALSPLINLLDFKTLLTANGVILDTVPDFSLTSDVTTASSSNSVNNDIASNSSNSSSNNNNNNIINSNPDSSTFDNPAPMTPNRSAMSSVISAPELSFNLTEQLKKVPSKSNIRKDTSYWVGEVDGSRIRPREIKKRECNYINKNGLITAKLNRRRSINLPVGEELVSAVYVVENHVLPHEKSGYWLTEEDFERVHGQYRAWLAKKGTPEEELELIDE